MDSTTPPVDETVKTLSPTHAPQTETTTVSSAITSPSLSAQPEPAAPISVTTITSKTGAKVNIAIIGCVHGALDEMYKTCHVHQQKTKQEIHIVLCCGDFESMRDAADLDCLAAPPKYRLMADFYKYYNGTKKAPILTLFTHGNHEASNYLMELPYGGWVAPNIFFMGFTNVVTFFGITIAAIGGIHKPTFTEPRHESCPLTHSDLYSLYHTRQVDAWMLSQYPKPIDIVLSHDWPTIATTKGQGDLERLLKFKPDFAPEIQQGTLGSPSHSALLERLRPLYWFSAHLHCKFPAVITHSPTDTGSTGKGALPAPLRELEPKTNTKTLFLGLDKILPNRAFMHVMPYPISSNSTEKEINLAYESEAGVVSPQFSTLLQNLTYDQNWIDVLKLTQPLYPRAKGSKLTIKKLKKEGDKDFYQQFNGKLCTCISDCSDHASLFMNQAQLQEILYPGSPQAADVFDAIGQLANPIPAFSFKHTSAPIFPTPQELQDQYRHRMSLVQRGPDGRFPRIDPNRSTPPFRINPQTILFCNQNKLLIPVFFDTHQWCSPSHAVKIWVEAQKAKVVGEGTK